jgi:hypothetical protein
MTREMFTYLDVAVTVIAAVVFGGIYLYLIGIRMDKQQVGWHERYALGVWSAIVFIVIITLVSALFPKGYVWFVGLITLLALVIDYKRTNQLK